MAGNSNLTREFFEKQEVDDTLQKIREQYLASKKNLQVLMKKQNEESPKMRIDSPVRPVKSSNFTNGDGPVGVAKGPSADDLILLNEVRSLRRMTVEQQQQLRMVTNELLVQKRTTAELQNKIVNLQSQVTFLESNFLNYNENFSPRRNEIPSPVVHRTEPRNFSPSPYSPPIEDNTMKLIQISKPR